ncbi:MAG: ATP-binding cassette domain-containing protein [Cyanobacteria bacterium]|nr:ATP-binding cassette domain-containing protein [Cyanobacteriota bacterium]
MTARRIKTPTVLQYEAVECGAASLKIVLGYLGKVVPLAELRERCGISRDGVNGIQLKRTALSYGLEVRAYRCSADQLRRSAKTPAILFWNFNHFLVLEGFEGDKVYLSDPASGRRSVVWEEFLASFTGVVLELNPGPNFQPGGNEPDLYHRVPQLLRPYASLIPWILVVALVGAVPELFIAGATAQFIDAFLQEGRQNIAIPVIWITTIAAITVIGLLNIQKLLLRLVGNLLVRRVASMLYISMFSLPYRYFLQRMGGELSQRLSLPFSLVQLGVTGVIDFMLSLGSGLLALVVGLLISPWLSLLTLLISGGNAALSLWLREWRKGDNFRLAMVKGKAMGIGIAILRGIESIKASGLENEAFVMWSSSFNESLEELQKQSLANALIGVVGTTSSFLLRTSVVLLGGLLIIMGQLSLGELMAFQFLMGLIQAPLQQLTVLTSQLQQLDGEMGRLNDVVDTAVDPTVRSFQLSGEAAIMPSERQLQGRINVHELGFQFSHTTPLLFEGLNMDITPGMHLSIVGASGSGKSTLLRVISGLLQPTHGTILYDNRPWMEWDDPTLRHSMALVSQDVFLFGASLLENITLWDGRFSEGQVLEALADAGLLEELGGAGAVQQTLQEDGGNLSGGQRQRVEIARALLRKPSILLMDEATSALDDRRERQVLDAVKRRSPTLITVAHRLYAAEISDLVLVLDQGVPVELGPPQQLAANKGGPFQRLLEAESTQVTMA